ncbi:MAG: hypothetical protein ACREJP_02650 [Candidatus Methylomirabilales bacterium]
MSLRLRGVDGELYGGRMDDPRLGTMISSPDLANAVGDIVAGRTVAVARTNPLGCIVW